MISKYNVKYVTYQRKSSPVIIKLYKLRKKNYNNCTIPYIFYYDNYYT